MSRSVDWKDDYKTGDETIDEHHQHLFNLLHKLEGALPSNDRDTILRVADALQAYCKYHFHHEEALMKKHRYPEYEQHLSRHQHFSRDIEIFCQKLKSDYSPQEIGNLIEYLSKWLKNHILVIDHKLGKFLHDL